MQISQSQTHKIGLFFIVLGALALLGNIGFFGGLPVVMMALVFCGAGAFLVRRVYFPKEKQLWALILAFGLFAVAAAMVTGRLSGAYFLGVLAGGFGYSYYLDERRWWAVIPAGVLLTLAAVVASAAVLPWLDSAPLFFTGIAATFAFLYLLPNGIRWALYPAIASLVLALLSSSFTGGLLLPLVLIGGGVYLFRRQGEAEALIFPVPASPEAVTKEEVEARAEDIRPEKQAG